MTEQDILIRVALSLFIGGVIGLERERSLSWAGFRTFSMVALGAVTLSIVAQLLYEDYGLSNSRMDIARIPSYVISSIGFLGAGAILKDRQKVVGLTTAASIWTTAALGIAIGFGYSFLVAVVAISVVTILIVMKKLEDRMIRGPLYEIHLEFRSGYEDNVRAILKKNHKVKRVHLREEGVLVGLINCNSEKRIENLANHYRGFYAIESVRYERKGEKLDAFGI